MGTSAIFENDINFQTLRNRKCSCLICGNELQPDHGPKLVDTFKELFTVFCKYMRLEYDERKFFKFETETFPFCVRCRSRLVDIFNLNSQFETIMEQINKLVANAAAMIILSEQRKNIKLELNLDDESVEKNHKPVVEDPDTGCIYNSEKVHYFRRIAVRQFSPSVLLNPHVLKRKEKYPRTCSVPGVAPVSFDDFEKRENEFSSPSKTGGCLQIKNEVNLLEERSTDIIMLEPLKSNPVLGLSVSQNDFDWTHWVNEHSGNVGAVQLVLYRKSFQELEKSQEVWKCGGCNRWFLNTDKRNMGCHVMSTCGGVVTTQQNYYEEPITGINVQVCPESTLCRDYHVQMERDPLAGLDDEDPELEMGNHYGVSVENDAEMFTSLVGTNADSGMVTFEFSRALKDHVRRISSRTYVYQNKIVFEQEGTTWVCYGCLVQFNAMQNLELHLTMGCSGIVMFSRPQSSNTDLGVQNYNDNSTQNRNHDPSGFENIFTKGKLKCTRKTAYKFGGPDVRNLNWSCSTIKRTTKTGHWTYLYRGSGTTVTKDRLAWINGKSNWTCCGCWKQFSNDKAMESHILAWPPCREGFDNSMEHRRKFRSRTSPPNELSPPELDLSSQIVKADSTHFQFWGFPFHLLPNESYKCDSCYYTAKNKIRMALHIKGIHFRQLAIENMNLDAENSAYDNSTESLKSHTQTTVTENQDYRNQAAEEGETVEIIPDSALIKTEIEWPSGDGFDS